MKIAVVSPNKVHLNEIGKQLQAAGHAAVLTEGGSAMLAQVAEQDQPDLMLVEGIGCDAASFAPVEALTTRHPAIAVLLLCPGCTREFLLNAMRAGVREVLAAPVQAADLEAAVTRICGKLRGARSGPGGQVLAFIPCKGGSGATFLATSLGCQLAQSGSVLLVDLNLQFGDALSFVHDAQPASTLADVARGIKRLDASFLAACAVKVAPNFSVLAAPEDHGEAVEITAAHVEAVLALAVQHYDFVLVDIGRQVGTLAIKALDRATRIYPVMQASVPSLRNAKKLLAIFKSLDYGAGKVELVVNRFDHKDTIGVADIERALGKFTIHTVPNRYKPVTAAIDHGEPLAAASPSHPVLRQVARLADTLHAQPQPARGLFARLLRRAPAGA
ncbi:AAA family ATPase [Massilia terrae]|uniref:AAA family ATPase n=1 Tax=Massilia terrae TaxID=1811224 RepID=A0ABT2CRE9_9BURK|nr:AAA family ATPase [Massilia terrae]MCS0656549.1 AAA family ATPase [Massilia terrae]